MNRERMDPRLLNAFADGELEPEAAARLVMHLADCPEDQAVVDGIMVMNALLVRACGGPLDEPVPPAIRAAIFGPSANVTPFRRRVLAASWGLALAAGLAAAAVLLPRLGRDADEIALGPVPERSPVAEALAELAPGDSRLVARDVELSMIASYAVPGGYCREFAIAAGAGEAERLGLACTAGDGWQVAARERPPEADAGTRYVPAGGDDEDAIRTRLDALGAGPALSPEEEAAAHAAGWR